MFLYLLLPYFLLIVFFFFNDTATTEIYTLSLHDALPICSASACRRNRWRLRSHERYRTDRKSTRLNSSHITNSYAVFCLKKKKQRTNHIKIKKKKKKDIQSKKKKKKY